MSVVKARFFQCMQINLVESSWPLTTETKPSQLLVTPHTSTLLHSKIVSKRIQSAGCSEFTCSFPASAHNVRPFQVSQRHDSERKLLWWRHSVCHDSYNMQKWPEATEIIWCWSGTMMRLCAFVCLCLCFTWGDLNFWDEMVRWAWSSGVPGADETCLCSTGRDETCLCSTGQDERLDFSPAKTEVAKFSLCVRIQSRVSLSECKKRGTIKTLWTSVLLFRE